MSETQKMVASAGRLVLPGRPASHRIEQWGRVLFCGSLTECKETRNRWVEKCGNVDLEIKRNRKKVNRTADDFRTVCQALADLQTALVNESTERWLLSPRLYSALQASWAQWTPSDEDPTINLKAK